MKKIAEQQPPKEALEILATLQELGLNEQLLSSEEYILTKLQTQQAINNEDQTSLCEV